MTLTEWNTTTPLMPSRQTRAGLKCHKIQTVIFVERSGFCANGDSCKAIGQNEDRGPSGQASEGH